MDVFALEWPPRLGEATPKSLALAVALALFGAFAALQLVRAAAGLARWSRVAAGVRKVPEAPGGNWLVGHVLPLATSCAWERMWDWVKASPPLIRFRILHRTGVVVGDPQGLKRIFQTKQRLYEKDLDFSYNPFLPILGTGLVTANGAHWQKQRLLMAPALRIDMLDAIIPIAKRAVDRLSAKLETHRGTQEPVDMEEEFRLLTLQVIGEAILSLAPEECDRVFPKLYLPVMEESNRRVLQPWRYLYPAHVWQYNRRVRALNAYLIDIVRTRRQQRLASSKPAIRDILDRILTSVEERSEKWNAELEMQLCYELKTFLLAGHETSAAMLCWSLYELSSSPECMAKLRAEAHATFGEAEAEPTQEEVDSMQYSLGALKESLRKYSVVPVVTRNLAQEDELCGYTLPAGAWIICHLQAVHHLYKDPSAWRPERFLPGGEYDHFDEDIRPYMFVPFIQGPRNCLGQYFALLEARVVLSLLCKRFRFTPVDAKQQGVTHPTVIPVGPVNGMCMYIS